MQALNSMCFLVYMCVSWVYTWKWHHGLQDVHIQHNIFKTTKYYYISLHCGCTGYFLPALLDVVHLFPHCSVTQETNRYDLYQFGSHNLRLLLGLANGKYQQEVRGYKLGGGRPLTWLGVAYQSLYASMKITASAGFQSQFLISFSCS